MLLWFYYVSFYLKKKKKGLSTTVLFFTVILSACFIFFVPKDLRRRTYVKKKKHPPNQSIYSLRLFRARSTPRFERGESVCVRGNRKHAQLERPARARTDHGYVFLSDTTATHALHYLTGRYCSGARVVREWLRAIRVARNHKGHANWLLLVA
jgi:hypothetical protein